MDTKNNIPRLEKWIQLYASDNLDVKIRAAQQLVKSSDETPLNTLLDILDNLSTRGLGESVRRALINRADRELFEAMVSRLGSTKYFLRVIACPVIQD